MPPFRAFAALAALLAAPSASARSVIQDVEPHIALSLPADAPRTVALTLDACSGRTDRRILDVLVDNRVPATVFVTHRWLRKNAEALAILLAHPDLFEIENHGDRHVPAVTDVPLIYGVRTAGSIDAVRREVAGGADAILAATGALPHWFRGATARYSPDALAEIRSEGYGVAGFSLNADMGAILGEASVARRIRNARSGDVIIAHINQPGHAAGAGVAEGIKALLSAGVVFVRLDQAETMDLDRPRRPGPAARQ